MTREIAILKIYYRPDYYSSYSDGEYNEIVQHCTEFAEVSDEDFWFLQNGLNFLNNGNAKYLIVEKVQNQRDFIAKTVEGYKIHIAKEKEKQAREELERQKKKEEAAAKKRAKTEESKKKQLEKLAKELGLEVK